MERSPERLRGTLHLKIEAEQDTPWPTPAEIKTFSPLKIIQKREMLRIKCKTVKIDFHLFYSSLVLIHLQF